MKPPPEEKLLKLIRGKWPAPRPATAGPAEGAAPAPAGGAAAAIRRPPPEPTGRARRLPSLRAAIGLLGTVLGVELVILLVQAFRPLPMVTVPVVMNFPVDGAPSAGAPAEPAAPEIPSLTAAASRPLFAPPAASAAQPSVPSGSATQLASRLTLMGIVAGHPAQAIIEDSKTQKTYFVTEGQMVVDGAVLEQVLDNRVVLNLSGERVELGL